jgi:hypothetical protein
MLMHCRTNAEADAAAKFFNKLSDDNHWGLFAAAIHGGPSVRDTTVASKQAFKYPTEKAEAIAWRNGDPMPGGGRIVDVGVQCEQLGEGYDNPWQGLEVFLSFSF